MNHVRRSFLPFGFAALISMPLVGSVAAPRAASAQITIESMIIEFSPTDKPIRNLSVFNSADEPMLVETSAVFLEHAGFPDEKSIPAENVLISPKRFSIAAKGQRAVRLVLKKPQVEEQEAYRLSFVPKARGDEDDDENKPATRPKQIGLKILTGMGALLFVNPAEKRPELQAGRKGKDIEIQNLGNVSILVDRMKKCKKSVPTSCEPANPEFKRMYPRNVLTLADMSEYILKFDKTVEGNDTVSMEVQ